jgi:AcrR family transcriptional regulator
LTLFSDHGFHGTSMAKLANLADLPVGTIYRHFAGKDELIHALYVEAKKNRLTAMVEGLKPDMSLRERFDLFWRNTYLYCLRHPDEFKFTQQYAYSPYLKDVANSLQADVFQELGAFYAEGYRDSVFKPLPPQILTALISGPINILISRAIANNTPLTIADQTSAMNACWEAITN